MLAGWEGRTRSTKLSSESVLLHDLRHSFRFAQDSVGDLEAFHKFLSCLNHPEWMFLLATKKSLYYIVTAVRHRRIKICSRVSPQKSWEPLDGSPLVSFIYSLWTSDTQHVLAGIWWIFLNEQQARVQTLEIEDVTGELKPIPYHLWFWENILGFLDSPEEVNLFGQP